jgi:hypothetical protein
LPDQIGEKLFAALRPEIDRNPQLLDVVVVEGSAEIDSPTLVDEGRYAPQNVPSALPNGVLDPDHFCTERGHPLRRAGAGQLAAEVTDANTGQGSGRHDKATTLFHKLSEVLISLR